MNSRRLMVEVLSSHRQSYHTSRCYTYSVHKTLKTALAPNTLSRCIHTAKRTSAQPVLKPLENLQKYSMAPLLPKEDLIFDPSAQEISEAQKLFLPGPFHKIEFLKSAVFTEHLPIHDMPEVAFIGRSNVGKSSLIQILLSGAKDVTVRISKNPGHTKTLNFFRLGEKLSIVDMPGYGHHMPDHYEQSVENFLNSRPKLCRTLVLVDGAVGLGSADTIGLNMLQEFKIPFAIVMTKIDKAKPSRLIKNFMSVLKHRDENIYCLQQPFLVSSVTGDGVALLQAFIAYVSGNFRPEGL